uniref:Serine/threonine protein kinase n=1 Tax=Geoglobus ahangari TaxID=113653 RepID=A0A7C3YFX3_9EURY
MKGKHSEIILKGNRIVKRFKPELKYNFFKESQILTILQPFSFVPRLYSVNPRKLEIEMEFVKGIFIKDLLNDRETILEALKICRTLDLLGIQKEEMVYPYKHIIKADRVVFIDFERSVFKDRPSNVTQFLNYINSNLGIFSINELKEISKKYKKIFSDEVFNVIFKKISEHLR